MSVQLKRGQCVSLSQLALTQASKQYPVSLSNTEKIKRQNDLSALHILMRVRGV